MLDEGVWRTIGGRRGFIKAGQSLDEAMRECGKFEHKGGQAARIADFGEAYAEYSGKPDEAIEKLLVVKNGYVPAAIHKEEVGDVDFVWGKEGKDGYGLAHIIERRNGQGIDGEAFARKIPRLIADGDVLRSKNNDRAYITDNNETAVVRLDYDGQRATWLVTAYLRD